MIAFAISLATNFFLIEEGGGRGGGRGGGKEGDGVRGVVQVQSLSQFFIVKYFFYF